MVSMTSLFLEGRAVSLYLSILFVGIDLVVQVCVLSCARVSRSQVLLEESSSRSGLVSTIARNYC